MSAARCGMIRSSADLDVASLTPATALQPCFALDSRRPLALHGDTGAGAGVRPVVPHRAVLCATVVPERDRVLGPAETALEQRILRMLVEIGKDRVAFVSWDADDVAGEASVDIERLPACLLLCVFFWLFCAWSV